MNVKVFVYPCLVEEYLNCFQCGVIIHEAPIDAMHSPSLGKTLRRGLLVVHQVYLL